MDFSEIADFETLYAAFIKARKGKRGKFQEAEYEQNILENTINLSKQLKSGTYKPSEFNRFYVYEPKKRLVQAPAFCDKIVQHAIVDNYIYEKITKSFIYENAASQKLKGTFFALDNLKFDLIDYYRKNKTSDGWVLKCDIRHFFANINHTILKKKLRKVIKDKKIMSLVESYIDASEEGLPLGYQTSQLFALLYLDKFDHYVKEKLRIKYYGRYMDDFYLICSDKNYLIDCRKEIKEYLGHLELELNEKTQIFPLKNGLDFLGFHTYITDTGKVIRKLRRNSIKRQKSKIKYWKEAYPKGEITKEKVIEEFTAWDAHAAHGDTLDLRRKFALELSDTIQDSVKIHKPIRSNSSKCKKNNFIKVGKSENQRLEEWYIKEIILKRQEE